MINSVSYPQNKRVYFQHLGLMQYQKAWDYQTTLFEQIVAEKLANRQRTEQQLATKPTNNYLLFCQHTPVYTLGKSGNVSNLLLNQKGLESNGVEFFHINRGGDITFHGPGQLVGYPVLDLENFFTDIHKYLRLIEEAIILTLADFGLQAGRIDGLTGVWLGIGTSNPRKICAIGVKTGRWVSMHGFALNVATDLSYFKNIIPCGISDKAVTSMQQELGVEPHFADVEELLLKHLETLFEWETIW